LFRQEKPKVLADPHTHIHTHTHTHTQRRGWPRRPLDHVKADDGPVRLKPLLPRSLDRPLVETRNQDEERPLA
jgi:hypothetical protein